MTSSHPRPELAEPLAPMTPDVDPDGAALALAVETLQRALLEHQHGAEPEAALAAAEAADRFGRLDRVIGRARALRLQADALIGAGHPAEAVEVVALAAAAFAVPGAETTAADRAGCEATLGAAYRVLGDFDAAEDHLERAAVAYDDDGRAGRAALCRLDRAVVLHASGQVAEAAALLEAVRPVLVRTRRGGAVATCDFDLGVALHDLGSMDDAVEHLQKARATFLSLGQTLDVAGCNQNLGVALHAMGRSEEAVQRLRDARLAFGELDRDRDATQCDHNLAVVLRALGDDAEADRLEAGGATDAASCGDLGDNWVTSGDT